MIEPENVPSSDSSRGYEPSDSNFIGDVFKGNNSLPIFQNPPPPPPSPSTSDEK